MADWYVDSNAVGAGTGADWANAYTTLKAAAEAAGTAAGDDLWVAHDHNETSGAAVTITFKGTSAAPTRVMCVNKGGSVPPVAADLRTTGAITVTGGFALTLTTVLYGAVYIEGLILTSSSGATTASGPVLGTTIGQFVLKNCTLARGGTSGGSLCITGGRTEAIWINVNTSYGVGSDAISAGGILRWFGGSVRAGATGNFYSAGTSPSVVELYGVDLSNMANAAAIFTSGGQPGTRLAVNCKLPTNAVLNTGAGDLADSSVMMLNCDSAGTNYRTEKANYVGAQVMETTIVRTGGATDGTTPVAWKIVTSAHPERMKPYESLPISVWNEATGAGMTATVYGTWGGAAVPLNDEIWIEVEYLGSAASPLSSFVSSGPATILTAGANVDADAVSVWGGGTTDFKLISPSFTPAMKGPITVRVKAAKASSTFYIDPKIVLT